MRILITGAKGQLGLELSRQIKKQDNLYTVISTDHHTLDITDVNQVNQFIGQCQPQIIINCAAYTQVDKCEEEVGQAYKINSLGPKYLAIASEGIGAKFVQISTDYVFDGKSVQPYREGDRTNPQSIYGKSKLEGEEAVRTFCKRHFIIRTAWLYGEGNNFVRTMLKLAETNTELNVVGDQFGSPTYTKDLATAIINLMKTEHYGTYHGTCEGQCSWYDFAVQIFKLKEIEIKVNKVTSEQFVRPAKRPKYSVLENANLKKIGLNTFRSWQEALEDYLDYDKTWQEVNLGGQN